ncbi:hypothetical protein TNCV_4807191 [Trichonephila clavipes]|nr:hypothetical protein TNCV_4807191 [Trichonephila clavipes]
MNASPRASEDPPCRGVEAQSPHVDIVMKYGEKSATQISFGRCSKLRNPSPIALCCFKSSNPGAIKGLSCREAACMVKSVDTRVFPWLGGVVLSVECQNRLS